MSNGKIELDHAGIDALLKSGEIQKILLSVAESRIAVAQGNYETEAKVMPTRAVVGIKAADARTYNSNLKHNTLAKMVK